MKSKNALRLAVLCAVISACSVPVMATPATNPPGQGPGVAIGTGSDAPKAENVAIGKNAIVQYTNGSSAATGDVVVGSGANINNYASQGGSVAIGKNAHVENMAGGQEASFAFGQTNFSGSMISSSRIPADPTKVVGSVAVGDNTFARTGSTMIGSHNYSGALGDTNVTRTLHEVMHWAFMLLRSVLIVLVMVLLLLIQVPITLSRAIIMVAVGRNYLVQPLRILAQPLMVPLIVLNQKQPVGLVLVLPMLLQV